MVQPLQHLGRQVGVVVHEEVHARRPAVQQPPRLRERVLHADGRRRVLVLGAGDGVHQVVGQVHVEVARDVGQQALAADHLQARDDRRLDAGGAAAFHELEVGRVVEEHLRDDVVGARVDLGLQVLDVVGEAGRLEVLLGIGGHAHAEIAVLGVGQLVQVVAAVHVLDLAHDVDGVLVARAAADLLPVGRVAAHRQDVVDAQERQLDQRVLGLLLGEAVAEQMRDRLHVVAVLQRGAEAEGAGPLARDVPLVGLPVELLEPGVGGVVGHVDEERLEGDQLIHELGHVVDAHAALGRRQLEAEEGVAARGQRLADFQVHPSRSEVQVASDDNSGRREAHQRAAVI